MENKCHYTFMRRICSMSPILQLLDEFSFLVDGKGFPDSTKQSLMDNLVDLVNCIVYRAGVGR